MRPVRVLLLRREVPTGGGPESLILDIARHIDRGRFEMHVATFGPRGAGSEHRTPLLDALRECGTPTTVLGAAHAWDPRPAGQLARLLDDRAIEILHTHDHRSNLIGLLATRRRPTLRVATLHQPLRRHWWLRHWEILDEWMVQRFDRVLPVADAVSEELVRKHPQMRERAITVLNGVDLARFTAPAEPEAVRVEFGIPRDALLCVNVGRFQADKNLAGLLDAARLVADRRPDVYWLLAGQGPLEPVLRERCRRLGLDQRVRFAGFRRDVPRILAAADVFVVASSSEGLSVAILEAMAAGRPVVATRVGGTPEVVRDGECGLIVEPGDVAALAQAVRALLDDPPRRAALGLRARQRVAAEFTVQRMVQRIERVYTELLTRSRQFRPGENPGEAPNAGSPLSRA
ncbi:MAG: glycosyltransferase [Phycisphaerae bacterium]